MTLYAIANYKMALSLVSVDIYYDKETAHKIHEEKKRNDPDGEHWLHFIEDPEEIKDIPLRRDKK